jgi:excisionase family DNA binding protein
MTYKQLAAWWNVPVGTIYSWVARGCIPYVRLGNRSVRFEPATLEKWVARRRYQGRKRTAPAKNRSETRGRS